MDIKKLLQEFIDSEETLFLSNTHIAMEKIIYVMLEEYTRKQNKTIAIGDNKEDLLGSCDIYASQGFDSYIGGTGIRIMTTSKKGISREDIEEAIMPIYWTKLDIKNLIIVVLGDIPKKVREEIALRMGGPPIQIFLWDLDDIVRICADDSSLFLQTYENMGTFLVQEIISKGYDRENYTYKNKKEQYLSQLKGAYEKDDLVLVLGAGVSRGANVMTWQALISELYVSLIDQELRKRGIEINAEEREKIAQEMYMYNSKSPLLQTRFLRQGFKNDFENLVTKTLYKDTSDTSDLLKEIAQLCIPNRGKLGIRAIISYNFDDLVEKNLKRLKIKYHSVYCDGVVPDSEEIGVYHVHGFLPQIKAGYENLTNSLLVFSEEGYHKLMLEPYNWANITQLNYFINNTCLFVGLSMTDPNMRRLLDVAMQKEMDGKSRHYAILKRFKLPITNEQSEINKFEPINEELQEAFYKELGVNVIWIDDYSEIPQIISAIKNTN